MPDPSIRLLFMVGVVLITITACAPITPATDASPPDVTVLPSQGVSVTPQQRGETLILEVTSETGIGSAQVSLPDAAAYDDILLRLHLSGLEELQFVYPQATVLVAVSSGDLSVREQAQPAGQATLEPIAPGNPWWMEVGILREQAGAPVTIPLPDGYFDVSVPRDFLQGDHSEFTVSWIDFYR